MKNNDEMAFFALLATDFKAFVQMAFREVNPGTEYLHNWHIDSILHQLDLARMGQRPRLILNLPPRSLKSFLVSIAWPAFLLGKDPAARVICVSYSDELGESIAAGFRKVVMSDWYRKAFPAMKVLKNTATEVTTDKNGGRIAISVGGSLTGRGGDIIIIDDPIKPEDAYSDRARERVNQWFINTLLSRLNDKSLGLIVLVMQRLHMNDLTGYLKSLGSFQWLALPAIAMKDQAHRTGPTPEDVYFRKEGEALHPERDSLSVWEDVRRQVGQRMFNAQYQQSPEAPDGSIFKKKYIKHHKGEVRPHPKGRLWISIDTAMSTSETSDYTAMTIGYTRPEGHFILRASRGHWEYEDVKARAAQLSEAYPKAHFIIEAANTGISLTQYLRNRGVQVTTHEPRSSKEARAYGVLRAFEEGRFFLARDSKHAQGLDALEQELLLFPHSRHDDQVDSVVQALTLTERWISSMNREGFYVFG